MNRLPALSWLLSLAALLALHAPAGAATALPFSDGHWELRGEQTAFETVDGRETLRLTTGWAFRRDVRLQDGSIDLDVQVTRRRSFVYLTFRMVSDKEFEDLYLRPHKSGLPDALQYAPVFQGQSAWQLFHGPGGTAAVELEPGVWTHLRLVLKGAQAAVFVGDMAKPALVIPRLGRAPQPGYLALRGFLPAGVPGEGPIARYANVSIDPEAVPFDFSTVPAPPGEEPGAVRAWRVSRAVAAGEGDPAQLPEALLRGETQVVEAEPGGRVVLHHYVQMPGGGNAVSAAARVQVHAEQAGLRRFDLGFSDAATVFLNGQPLYHGDDSYRFDNPRREGLMHFGQAALYLPLRAGDNELVVVVSDGFGGWGLMGRFADSRGLTVTPGD